MKNHPGAALPPSNRQEESEFSGLPNPSFSQTVGSITTSPQSCQWCHKQYASKVNFILYKTRLYLLINNRQKLINIYFIQGKTVATST